MAEELPPMTIAGLTTALENPNFRGYVYIGRVDDGAWDAAVGAQDVLPAVRVYIITARDLADEFRRKFKIESQYVGVVFGWELDVQKKLTPEQAEDFRGLLKAIRNA